MTYLIIVVFLFCWAIPPSIVAGPFTWRCEYFEKPDKSVLDNSKLPGVAYDGGSSPKLPVGYTTEVSEFFNKMASIPNAEKLTGLIKTGANIAKATGPIASLIGHFVMAEFDSPELQAIKALAKEMTRQFNRVNNRLSEIRQAIRTLGSKIELGNIVHRYDERILKIESINRKWKLLGSAIKENIESRREKLKSICEDADFNLLNLLGDISSLVTGEGSIHNGLFNQAVLTKFDKEFVYGLFEIVAADMLKAEMLIPICGRNGNTSETEIAHDRKVAMEYWHDTLLKAAEIIHKAFDHECSVSFCLNNGNMYSERTSLGRTCKDYWNDQCEIEMHLWEFLKTPELHRHKTAGKCFGQRHSNVLPNGCLKHNRVTYDSDYDMYTNIAFGKELLYAVKIWEVDDGANSDDMLTWHQEIFRRPQGVKMTSPIHNRTATEHRCDDQGTCGKWKWDITFDQKCTLPYSDIDYLIAKRRVEVKRHQEFLRASSSCFYIQSKMNGKVLDIKKSGGSGTDIIMYRKLEISNQLWKRVMSSDGWYYYESCMDGNLVLNVQGGNPKEGSKIIVFNKKSPQGQIKNQLFYNDEGFIKIHPSVGENLVVDIKHRWKTDEAPVLAWTKEMHNGKPTDGVSQMWEEVPVNRN